jgi:hypothetical protein
MADYINKNILCEAYLHIHPQHMDQERQAALLNNLRDFTTQRARFFLYEKVELDLRHKKGSLTLYVTILGTVGALYKAIGAYPKFREGAIAAFDDVKRLAEVIISEGLFDARARRTNIVRLEARTGVVGSLRKIVSQLDLVRQSDGARSARWMAAHLDQAFEDIRTLMENLRSEADRDFVAEGLAGLVDQLPVEPSPVRKKKNDPRDIEAYKRVRSDLRQHLRTTVSV